MNRKTSGLLIATLAMVLVAGSPVLAKGGHHHKHKKHWNDPLLTAAYELEESVRYVHKSAEGYAHHGTYREDKALRRLHELDSRARHFRLELKNYGPYSNHVRNDYYDLVEAHRRAKYAMRWLHPYREIAAEFERVNYLMRDLDYAYGARLARYDRRHGHRDGRPGSYGYAQFGTRWDNGHASVRVQWDDE